MRFILLVIILGTAQATKVTFTPTCAVTVTTEQRPYLTPLLERILPGRLLTVTPSKNCPKNGAAYVRFRSAWGSQPDAPPGLFTLRPGEKVTRRVPWDWWVEARNKGLTWTRQEESP